MYSPSSTFIVGAAADYSPTSSVDFSSPAPVTGAYSPSTDFTISGGTDYSPTANFVFTAAGVDPSPGLTPYTVRTQSAWQLDAAVVSTVTVSVDMMYDLIPAELLGRLPAFSLQAQAYYDWTSLNRSLSLFSSVALGAADGGGRLPLASLSATGSGEWGRLTGELPAFAGMGTTGAIAAGVVPGVSLSATGSGEWGTVVGALPGLSLQGTVGSTFTARLPAFSATASVSDLWGVGAGILPTFAATAAGAVDVAGSLPLFELETRYGVLQQSLPAFSISAAATTGSTGQLSSVVFLAPGLLGYGAADMAALVPGFTAAASATTGGIAELQGRLPSFSLYSTATSDATAQLNGQLPLFAMQWAQLDGQFPRFGLASAPAVIAPQVGVEASVLQPVNWCINLSTGETASYTQFPFQRVVRFADGFYGVNASGLYRLGGETDAGQPIAVTLETAPMDFDSLLMKRVPYLYVGMTQGQARITSMTDGVAYGPFATEHGHKRVQLPRGAKGRYWGFRLVNVQGGPFRLDKLDVVIETTTRRV